MSIAAPSISGEGAMLNFTYLVGKFASCQRDMSCCLRFMRCHPISRAKALAFFRYLR